MVPSMMQRRPSMVPVMALHDHRAFAKRSSTLWLTLQSDPFGITVAQVHDVLRHDRHHVTNHRGAGANGLQLRSK